MKRFIIPFSIAFFFHAALVWGSFDFLKKTPDKRPEIQFMTMTLSEVEAPQPVKKPVKKRVKKEKTKKRTPEKKSRKKELMPEQKTVKKVEEEKEDVDETTGALARVQKASPLYHYNPSPAFPKKARKRGWQGVVELLVLVDKKGNVSTIRVYKSSGYKLLDRSAMRSVKSWRFSPGRRGDEVVESEVIVPVNFSLTG